MKLADGLREKHEGYERRRKELVRRCGIEEGGGYFPLNEPSLL